MPATITTSKRFAFCSTLYLALTFAGFWFTTGGYMALIFLFIVLPLHLLLELIVVIICRRSRQVRFSNVLFLIICLTYTIALLFNFGDSGFYGLTCDTKNLIQSLFDRSRCNGLWVGFSGYTVILSAHGLGLLIFIGDVIQRQIRPRSR
jgi:hypothetical protein